MRILLLSLAISGLSLFAFHELSASCGNDAKTACQFTNQDCADMLDCDMQSCPPDCTPTCAMNTSPRATQSNTAAESEPLPQVAKATVTSSKAE